jgi:hypothetical protein
MWSAMQHINYPSISAEGSKKTRTGISNRLKILLIGALLFVVASVVCTSLGKSFPDEMVSCLGLFGVLFVLFSIVCYYTQSRKTAIKKVGYLFWTLVAAGIIIWSLNYIPPWIALALLILYLLGVFDPIISRKDY